MADDSLTHTKSEGLKRLLRRRGRRTKTGANSGEKVYSWAEYGQVNFTPTGDHSKISRALGTLVAVGVLLIVPGMFIVTTIDRGDGFIPLDRIAGETLQAILTLSIFCLLMVLPVGLIAWIYVRLDGNAKKDRERLIKAADELRTKQARAQDEGANRAR